MRKAGQIADEPQQGQRAAARQAERTSQEDREPTEINWQKWWPFDRATGAALRQLNQKQQPEYEDALL